MKKQRRCLRCEKMFNSKSSGNRICRDCNKHFKAVSQVNCDLPRGKERNG
jgi:hypothetical protein